MFILYDQEKQKFPVKIWLENISQLDEGCIEQAINLSNLPFLHQWVVLMPDTHQGFGMPIGGVIAAIDTIIPNAVGKDIGCGMAYMDTNIRKSELSENEYKHLVGQIMRNIPTGFEKHSKLQESEEFLNFHEMVREGSEFANNQKNKHPELWKRCFPNAFQQIGTLGSGNHFIEIQEDENELLGIMVHSGSRNMGSQIADYFDHLAKNMNKQERSNVPASYDLAYLSVKDETGQDYIQWMNMALTFAMYNRKRMMDIIKMEMKKKLPHIQFLNEVNAHHNYAAKERHYGKEVWVHRKGAICVSKGMLGIIPGAMGSYSYIVEGLGNAESFDSCSHGAGRVLSRNKAKERYSVEDTLLDLMKNHVILGKNNKKDVSEESRKAYKDIDFVISQELDIVRPIKKLKTICVIKG
ncbi:tRNA-splicing ligase RtcB [Anaerosolibacter carboniphilus]|uniref:3'-phosphate/5'-hydroxy nucleic acid ligase n=1 Tax=Anaerosolibacter carboniphilus TaxID=1417629 RepID=A0A841KZA1_9FIRM|nr:RtcB family protein [Anaerosolibacter carboniphilus]MBB6216242.1 tRNA-splicing ligase RtcB [Anaerosolibacter carboniphilus]